MGGQVYGWLDLILRPCLIGFIGYNCEEQEEAKAGKRIQLISLAGCILPL